MLPEPRSKIHEMKYVPRSTDNDKTGDLLAVSTEDGRVIFYSTSELQKVEDEEESQIPFATPVAQLGGKQAGFPGRVKDFAILSLADQAKEIRDGFLVVTGNSEGVVRIWKINGNDLLTTKKTKDSKKSKDTTISQVGRVLSTYETGNRITCLASFIMLPAEDPSSLFDSEDESEEEEEEDDDESDSDASDE